MVGGLVAIAQPVGPAQHRVEALGAEVGEVRRRPARPQAPDHRRRQRRAMARLDRIRRHDQRARHALPIVRGIGRRFERRRKHGFGEGGGGRDIRPTDGRREPSPTTRAPQSGRRTRLRLAPAAFRPNLRFAAAAKDIPCMDAIPREAALAALRLDLSGLDVSDDPALLRKRSRDFFWYSPILNRQLDGLSADLIVTPRSEAEVIRVAAACARRRVPLTVRGGATGNYGQCVPLQGGVLLDMTAMTAIRGARPGWLRIEPGAKMGVIDQTLAETGWELRLHPSTKRTATIGGFVAGGSGGVGSATWGGLREPGNILAARVVTVEPEPRVIALRGDAAQKVNRAYGATGIITELEMPLAPRWAWIDVVAAFDDFWATLAFAQAVGRADGVVKKLLSPIAPPLPSYFGPMARACPEGQAVVLAMIAEPSMEVFRDMLAAHGGRVTHEAPTDEGPGKVPLYEYAWNHTTLQMLKVDRTVTYLQCLYPHDRLIEAVRVTSEAFPDEIIPHCEIIRFGGHLSASSLPVIRYTTDERLAEIIAFHEANGVMVANPHVVTLEDGSRHKRAEADQMGFKAETDPMGLLNPGKMRSYVPVRA
jgi:FAD/FMN-containing dehydrogenase